MLACFICIALLLSGCYYTRDELKDAEYTAYEEGHRDGYSEGYDDGYESGFDSGYWEGYDSALYEYGVEP